MKKKAKIIGYIIGVVLFISMIAGVTYAMYRKTLLTVDINGTSNNLDSYVIYTKQTQNISGTLNYTSSYNSANAKSVTVTFYQSNTSPYDLYGHIYLDVNSLDALTSYALKYKVIDNTDDSVVSEGSFYTFTSGESVLAAYNIPLNTTLTTYTVYIWLDEDLYDSDMAGNSLDIDVRCHATMKSIMPDYINTNLPNTNSAASYLTYKYSSRSKDTVENNSITYNYASSVGLMNDRLGGTTQSLDGGDIRYYGANPNNYVWLGDTYTSAYTFSSNGVTTTKAANSKKLWRIIGVFDGRLKLIQADPISITNLSWDTSRNASGYNAGYGINEWSQADLMKLLNPGYESNRDLNDRNATITVNNSLYWTKGTGTVYIEQSNATTANVSFANTGLSIDEKNMIDTATWYLGAYNGDPSYVNVQYAAERQSTTLGKICSSSTYCNDSVTRTSSWEGKVGLMYPSDYGYAVDLNECQNKTLSGYSDATCQNNWLKDTSASQWTISPRANSSNANYVFTVGTGRSVFNANAYAADRVRPVVFLKSGVTISGGDGSESNPYVLTLN